MSEPHRNPGERMYQAAMARKKQRDKEKREKIKARDCEQLQNITFTPQINRHYRSSLSSPKLEAKDRLYGQATDVTVHVARANVALRMRERAGCPFRPQINSK